MRITDFDIYQHLLQEKCGLLLEQDQSYLLDSRLAPIAKKWGYPSLEAMTAAIHGVPDRDLVHDVIEVMTARDTSFFRDAWPFHMIRDELLPILRKARNSQKKIRVWCAAAATGQEPYSVCLLFRDKLSDLGNCKLEVLATDISSDALEQAKPGVYSQFEAQRGLPVRTLLKYFKQVDDHNWQINSDIRKMVKFQPFNLLDNMGSFGKFDLILCRNVLSTFDPALREKTLEKLAGQLEKDGFLLLGNKEKSMGNSFRPYHERRGVFVHKDSDYQAVSLLAAQTLAKSTV